MLRAGIGISTLLEPEQAAEEAVSSAVAELGQTPAASIVLVSAAHGRSLPDLVARAHDLLGGPMVGGSVEGVIARGVEVSSYPALLVVTIGDAEVLPFLVRDVGGGEARVGEDLVDRLGGSAEPEDLVVVLADSLGINAGRLAEGFAEHLGSSLVLGTGAAPTPRGPAYLWNGSEIATDGVSGLVVRGVRTRLGIAQAGRRVGPFQTVTRARGNWILGLDGRRALDAYLEVARSNGLEPWDEASPPLLVGLPTPWESDQMRVRNVSGFDRARSAFSVPEPMRSGDRIALVRLDPDTARCAFADQLEELREPAPAMGLYFNCRARGASLFGEAGVEATCLANAFADSPIAGAIGPYQLAPLAAGRSPVVLTYAGALALIDRS